MKCPKCGYTSFAYLGSCGKCGQELAKAQEVFGLYARRPIPPDLTAYVAVETEAADVTDVTDSRAIAPSSRIDRSQLDEIGLDLVGTFTEAEPTPVETAQTLAAPMEDGLIEFDEMSLEDEPTRVEAPQTPAAPPETGTSFTMEIEEETELLIMESEEAGVERAIAAANPLSPPIDINQLDETVLELEVDEPEVEASDDDRNR